MRHECASALVYRSSTPQRSLSLHVSWKKTLHTTALLRTTDMNRTEQKWSKTMLMLFSTRKNQTRVECFSARCLRHSAIEATGTAFIHCWCSRLIDSHFIHSQRGRRRRMRGRAMSRFQAIRTFKKASTFYLENSWACTKPPVLWIKRKKSLVKVGPRGCRSL